MFYACDVIQIAEFTRRAVNISDSALQMYCKTYVSYWYTIHEVNQCVTGSLHSVLCVCLCECVCVFETSVFAVCRSSTEG